MTPRRLQFLHEHAQAGRHVTGAMALELLAHVERLRNALETLLEEHTDCPSCDVCTPAYAALGDGKPE